MLRAVEWILLGSVSAGAIAVGVYRYNPARIGPWLLLAASVVSLAVGDVFFALDRLTAADLCYTAMFLLVALCLYQLTLGGAVLADRSRLIDLVAFTCSSLLVVWVFVLPRNGLIAGISATDVLGDLLLTLVAGRLIVAAWCNWSALLLGVGALGVLAADVTYPLFPDWIGEIGYVVLYLSWGAAALHPSMARLTAPVQLRQTPWHGRWAILLGLSVATPPTVLLIESLSGKVEDGVVIAVAGALTLALTFTRLGDSLRQHSAALTRERGLREASAALVAAADVPAVDRAVRAAIAQLLPGVHQIVFAVDNRQLALQVPPAIAESKETGAAGAGPDAGAGTGVAGTRPDVGAGTGVAGTRPDVGAAGAGTGFAGGGGGVAAFAGAAGTAGPSPRSWWAGTTGPTADQRTLVCPLWLEPLAVARPSGGALVLTGGRNLLAAAQDTLEVLAGQAALALDRITLVEAVGRRDSDLYLRAVIRNTADAMLVIDADQRIRYASPALRAMLGLAELPPLATLDDLVHPDDRSQIRQALQREGDGVVFCALRRPDETQILVEATYRDLREDRLVQGLVVTMRDVTHGHSPGEQLPQLENQEELPAWVNRRSAQHKFRY